MQQPLKSYRERVVGTRRLAVQEEFARKEIETISFEEKVSRKEQGVGRRATTLRFNDLEKRASSVVFKTVDESVTFPRSFSVYGQPFHGQAPLTKICRTTSRDRQIVRNDFLLPFTFEQERSVNSIIGDKSVRWETEPRKHEQKLLSVLDRDYPCSSRSEGTRKQRFFGNAYLRTLRRFFRQRRSRFFKRSSSLDRPVKIIVVVTYLVI